MTALATMDFRDVVVASGLLAAEQFDSFVAQASLTSDEPAALARALVQARLLTTWQCEKLLAGRRTGYFLGKYRLLHQLGAGSMGAVFLAEHKLMRHKVAIKVLARPLAGKDRYLQRFEQEARAAAAVNHPRVVRAFDFDCDGDTHYLVMEYAEGENLQKIVLRDGVLPIPLAAECIKQAAEGLAAIHEAGLVHRDIKPSNLLIDSAGNVRILDLGLARIEDPAVPSLTLMHDSKTIGTVDYLAPEQARNSHAIDGRADLYSLGCTLYFLLCGARPFIDGTLTQRVVEHQSKLPLDVRRKRADCPSSLAVICHKLLAKEPDQRYASAQEVVAVVQRFLVHFEPRIAAGDISLARELSSGPRSKHPPAGSDPSGLTETQAVASSDTSTSGDDSELGLADDDGSIVRTAGIIPGSHSISTAGSPQTGAPGPSAPSPSAPTPLKPRDAPTTVATEESLPPLPQNDALADLLEQELPNAAPLDFAAANPSLASPVDPLGTSALGTGTLGTGALGAGALGTSASLAMTSYQKALAERDNQPPKSVWQSIQAILIVEDGPGGVSYALWFLIASGIAL